MVHALTLPDPVVAVAGDWHGNAGWAGTAIPAIRRADRHVTTILHVGDFWPAGPFLNTVDYYASSKSGNESARDLHVYVTLGNHEPWGKLSSLIARGAPVQVSKHVTVLPRPYRFKLGGRTVLSLGGAASVDRQWRTEGHDWWPDEMPTDEQCDRAIAPGPADLMITHESPEGSPVRAVQNLLAANPHHFPTDALAYSAESRRRIGRVWRAVNPELLVHGHMHVAGGGQTDDGRRVMSLDRDTMANNMALLDMATLTAEPISVRRA